MPTAQVKQGFICNCIILNFASIVAFVHQWLEAVLSMLRFSLICLLLIFLQKLNFESTQVVGSTSVTTPSEKESFQYPPSPGGKTPSTLHPSTCAAVSTASSTTGTTVATTSVTTSSTTGVTSTMVVTTTTPATSLTSEGTTVSTAPGVSTTVVTCDTTATTSVTTPASVTAVPTTTKTIPATNATDTITTTSSLAPTTSNDSKVVHSLSVGAKKFTVTPVDESKLPSQAVTDDALKDKNLEEQPRSRAASTSRQISQDQLQTGDLSEVKSVPSQPEEKTVQTADASQLESTTVVQKEGAPSVTNEQQATGTQQSQPPVQSAHQSQPQQAGGAQPQRAPSMKSEYSIESLPSGYTSQESTVTRAKQKGQEHMDFENLKQKLDQLSGKQKPAAEGKPQGSLPTTPCNQIGVDPGQIPQTSVTLSSQQQVQQQTGQPIASQPKLTKEAQTVPTQQTVATSLPIQPNAATQQQVNVQHGQQIPASLGQVPLQHLGQLVHVSGQQLLGMNQQVVSQPSYQPSQLQHQVMQQQSQQQQQQQYINSQIQSQQAQQHNQALNYNTWHGGQNPLFQQPMTQTLQYLQQQQQIQQQQQHLQHIQNLLHQQQQIQQQLAAAGVYVPISQISLPLTDAPTMFNPRRQLEFGLDPQQPLQHAGSYPALVPNTLLSPPTNPLTSGPVRSTGLFSGIPPTVPDNYGTTPKVKRVERPADIHNLEQALIEKLHSHKRTTHAGVHHAGYVPAAGHDVLSVLSTPSTPGHLMQSAPVHNDPTHQTVPHLGVSPELVSTIPQHSQEYPEVQHATENEPEQKSVTAGAYVVSTDEKCTATEVNRDGVEPDSNTTVPEVATTEAKETVPDTTEQKKAGKSRFSVTIVQEDPLKPSAKVNSDASQEKAVKVDSGKDQEVAAKVTKRQVSKRGRFQVTTVKDPIGESVAAVKQEATVSKTETNQVGKNNSLESVKSELKDHLAPTTVSDKASSATSGSDYQATIDSTPTSGENSAENTAGSDITPALTKAVSTLAQQISQDSSVTKAPETKPNVDVTAKTISTVGLCTNVSMTRDGSSMVVSVTPMAGLGAVQSHQSVNPPLVAHMVADTLPQTPSLTSQHLSSHQHLIPQSCLASSSSTVGNSGMTLQQSLPHYQQAVGVPLVPSTVAATTAPNSANVSMHSWRKTSLPVVLEMSASDHNHVDVDEDFSSLTNVASHISSNYYHIRHHSLPCITHAENKPNSGRSNSCTGVFNPQAINNSNPSSSRSHHSALNVTHRDHRRQSAPAVHKSHTHNAQMRGNEYVAHDAGWSTGMHTEESCLAAHQIGSSFPNVYTSVPGSYMSAEVSSVLFHFCLYLLHAVYSCVNA